MEKLSLPASHKEKMQKFKGFVPNFFTVGNMLAGFIAILFAFKNDFTTAVWLIILGGLFDTVDGKIARFFDISSDFGVEYDSLSDVITFGAAPSFLLYNAFFQYWETPGQLMAFFPLMFGSIRLARFNSELVSTEKDDFTGLPIPVAAITLGTAVLFWQSVFNGPLQYPQLLGALVVVLSVLMVTRFKYPAFPKFEVNHASTKDKWKFFLLVLGIISAILWQEKVVFPLMLLLSFSGVIRWLREWLVSNGQ